MSRALRFTVPSPVKQKKAKESGPVILCRRHGAGLFGIAPVDAEQIQRFDAKADLYVQITHRRHPGRLRLYWAILKIVADNLQNPVTPETLHAAVKLMLGVSVVVSLPDSDFLVPGSIAFDSMSESAFRDFLDRFLTLVGERLLPGVNIRALEAEGRMACGVADAPSLAASRARETV